MSGAGRLRGLSFPSLPKALARRCVRFFGLDVVRAHENPIATWLGLARTPVRSILDIGANEGQFARRALSVFPDARLYCFEPLEAPGRALEDWAAGRGGRVRVFHVALGDGTGRVEMRRHVDHPMSSSLLETTDVCERHYPFTRSQETVVVPLTTLDAVVESDIPDLVPDCLVKIDVQGFEDRVIRGAARTLSRAAACIVEVGIDLLYADQAEFGEVCGLLRQAGLAYAGNLEQAYAPDGRVLYVDAVFVRR